MTVDGGQWKEDCPARGAGLPHAHWSKCGDEHRNALTGEALHGIGQCCHCGHTRTTSWPTADAPDFSMARQLKEMGMPIRDGTEHAEAELVEPKMAQGLAPFTAWPRWKRSRVPYGRTVNGELSDADRKRLRFFCHVVRDRTQEDRHVG